MRYRNWLKLARNMSLSDSIADKQHIVVCLSFTGKQLTGEFLNTEAKHAEQRAVDKYWLSADRLIVYRFNRADPTRLDRPSCPCFRCCPLIQRSNVRKVEFMSPLGPTVVKVSALEPYNGKDLL